MWVMKDFTVHLVIKPENWIFISKYSSIPKSQMQAHPMFAFNAGT